MAMKKFKGKQKSLSMTGEGIIVSINFRRTNEIDLFLRKLKPILIKFKVQPNLTKDSEIDFYRAKKTIKNYVKFKELINKFDNNRIFQSYISNKLKI